MNNGSIGIGCETVTGAKTLELSPYDQQRRPHKAISDSTEIAICPRTLSSELCCPICLDLLTTTMTTKECLHRFCHECITTALLRGNKECPTCRKKLVSKRSLRPDPNFDMLINKIWPDRKVYDTMQERALERFRKQSNVEALQKSIEVGLRDQAAHRRQRVQGSYDYERRKRRPRLIDPATVIASPSTGDQPQNSDDGESTNSPQQPDPHTPSTASASDSNLNTPPLLTPADIELELSPVDELQKRNNLSEHCKQPRYLKTTENATVGHLCEYLALRIGMDESEEECRRLRQETIDSAKVDGADQSHAAPLQPAAPRRLACSIFVQKEDGLEQLDSTTTLREIRHRLRAVRHHRRQLMRLKFDAVVPTAIEPTFEKNEAKIELKMENDL